MYTKTQNALSEIMNMAHIVIYMFTRVWCISFYFSIENS